MKILQASKHFFPEMGGMESYVLEISKELVELGCNVTVVTSTPGPPEVEGISVKRVKQWFKFIREPVAPKALYQMLIEPCDVIHGQYPEPFLNFQAAIASFFRRKPLFITYQNDLLIKGGLKGLFVSFVNATFMKFVFWRARKVISTTNRYKSDSDTLSEYAEKVVMIPNGVDLKVFNDKNRKQKIDPNKEKSLLFVGRFVPYKGLLELIELFSKLEKDFTLTVVGRGEQEKLARLRVKELGLEKRVEFVTDLVSNQKLADYYRKAFASVLASTSRQEGFGLVVLESMACGTPCIVSKKAGIAGILNDCLPSVVFDVNDFEGFSKALENLPGKEKCIEFASKYSWENNAKKLFEEYKKSLS